MAAFAKLPNNHLGLSGKTRLNAAQNKNTTGVVNL